jgi:hypothetical protein
MRNSWTVIHAGLATATCAAALALAAPAQAAGGNPTCDSGGSRIVCELLTPMTTSAWSINGAHISAFDNRSSISFSCTAGQVYTVSATWTYGGVTQSGSTGVRCSSNPWT